MARIEDMPDVERAHLLAKPCKPLGPTPWTRPPPLPECRVAIVTTAGLHRRSDDPFRVVDLSYRVIPGEIRAGDLTMTHSSVHFDRSGFEEDVNVVFPIDRLGELQAIGAIGSVADRHYSLMGAGWAPEQVEATVNELATLLGEDRVDAVCLAPV